MQSDNQNTLDINKIDRLLGSTMVSQISRMEQERASWMSAATQSHRLAEQMKQLVGEASLAAFIAKQAKDLQTYSLAEQMKRLVPENSLAVHTALQWQVAQKAEQESIRKMLDPLQNIRNGLLTDSATSGCVRVTGMAENRTLGASLVQISQGDS